MPVEAAPHRAGPIINIAQSHGIGPAPIQGRESHTTNIARFDIRLAEVQRYRRLATDPPFHGEFWAFVRDLLRPCEGSVGYRSEDDASVTVPKAPGDIQGLGQRVEQLGLVNPIHPNRLADACQLPLETVLTELLVATRVGLVRMRWAPECIRCGSAVMVANSLGALPASADCWGCGKPNRVHSLDKVMVTFTFAPDVLYVLANNYACTPSKDSMSHNAAFAPLAATNSGSGFRYSFGTGDKQLRGPLAAGRYRMHCPVSMTDNFLVVEREASDSDPPLEVPYAISEMVVSSSSDARKTMTVEHGRLHFDIFPDTRSFFVLWIQEDLDEELLLHLPDEERAAYTAASAVMHHPSFAMFQDQLVPGGGQLLDISAVYLVFTDIVGSTNLYASLGDGNALGVVHSYFEALFGAFAARGRIVKTIGDAVMASFPTGEAALRAATEGLEAVQDSCINPATGEPLQIRLGVHRGPAIVVPVNGINDYFGQTVNIAARIESAAAPSQCLVSENVLRGTSARVAFEELSRAPQFTASDIETFQPRGVDRSLAVRGLTLATSA